jgi:3D (Asp-Asp-Asp) domain-containing protein
MIDYIDTLPNAAFIFPLLVVFGALANRKYVWLLFVVALLMGVYYPDSSVSVTVIQEPPSHHREVTVTQYHYQKPSPTAILEKPVAGWTAAVSRELVHLGWMGRRIYLEGLGVFKVNDVMAESVEGCHVDIYAGSKDKAMKFGKRQSVAATVL